MASTALSSVVSSWTMEPPLAQIIDKIETLRPQSAIVALLLIYNVFVC